MPDQEWHLGDTLPPFGFHDSGIVSMEQTVGNLTLRRESVRQGKWRTEPGHKWNEIDLIDAIVVFTNVRGCNMDGLSGDSAEIMSWTGPLSTPAHEHNYRRYSFTFDQIRWRTLGRTPE